MNYAGNGSLLVKVLLGQSYGQGSPIFNANVSILALNFPQVLPVVIPTNASGEVQLPLPAGNYTVSVSDERFQFSNVAGVRLNRITEMDVEVNETLIPVLFSDLGDQSPATYAAPWQPISLAVRSSVPLGSTQRLFLYAFYSAQASGDSPAINGCITGGNGTLGKCSGPVVETPVTVVGSDVRVFRGSDLLWLTLEPYTFVPLTGLFGVDLTTYSATSEVMIHGG